MAFGEMSETIIECVKKESVIQLKDVLKTDLVRAVLYGSCARKDYTEDSDIDIAVLLKCDRLEAKKYNSEFARIATELAMKYFVIINFVSLPYEEFMEKNSWYAYFRNIEEEGEVLYG